MAGTEQSATATLVRGDSAVEIAASVEKAVREGGLAPGAALPTVRGLAATLGVSPTTVAGAYRILRERGLLITAGRRGTRISPAPPVAAAFSSPIPEGTRDLAAGNPDPGLLPRLGPFLKKLSPEPRLYSDDIHSPGLIRLARERFEADGLPCPALAVVSGALDGIERVLAARLRPGDKVAVEDPGYPGVLHLVRALGLVLVPVAIDDEGPLPEAVQRAVSAGARALVLTPRAQNPTGACLSRERTATLRAIVSRHPDLLIIEDDHCELAAGAAALTSCTAATSHWAIVRSVSKTLGPDLRLAILAGDEGTVARVAGRQLLGSRWVSHLLQDLVVALWSDPQVDARLTDAARRYAERRSALREALARVGIPSHGESGLNVWIPVAEETPAVQALAEAGYAVRAGEAYRIDSAPAIRVTTAALAPTDATRVAETLAAALRRPGGTSA